MPSAADKYQPASFNGYTFPVEHISIVGGLRDHVHEYPHSDGGAAEKLGRKLYTIKMRANFQDKFKRYPHLYPDTLNFLYSSFESGLSADLVIPTVGTLTAYAVNWTRDWEAKIRSGEKTDFEFREDLAQAFLVTELTNPSTASMKDKSSAFAAYVDAATLSPNSKNIFDQVRDGAAAVFAVFDTTAAFGNLVEAKLRGLEQIIQTADRLPETQSAANAGLANALHDLWAATRVLFNDLQGKAGGGLETYLTPMTMPVSQISKAIFGDGTHAVDIMQLNALVDPFRVLANTTIRYYPVTA